MSSPIVIMSWRTDKVPDAKQVRDRKVEELRKLGWTIGCYAGHPIDRSGFSVYGLEGVPRQRKK